MEGKSRGRPVKSEIRQNIIDILYQTGPMYGYKIHKLYIDIFPKITMRSIYYHLAKGTKTKEIEVDKVQKEKGDYSWGGEVEKIYYKIGKEAQPRENKRIREHITNKNKD
ncbi:MAG: hypothetical protein ACLFSL_01845 [Candidatus Woesearchaeota archaeon]